MSKPKTIGEAIANLSSESEPCDWQALADCFMSHYWMFPAYDEFDHRFRRHWVASWICTDTRVGLSIITLDGEEWPSNVFGVDPIRGHVTGDGIGFQAPSGARWLAMGLLAAADKAEGSEA